MLGREAHAEGRRSDEDERRFGSDLGARGLATHYSYDDALRLIGVKGPRDREGYIYDAAGNLLQIDRNRISTSFAVNELNQIQAANDTDYVYNADGELLDDGTHTYTWDAAGHLLSITNKQTGHVSAFTYDGLGRRVTDTETGVDGTSVTTTYLWCGLRICEKRGANETVLARYFPQGEVHNGQPLYYAQDQVGSVTALVNAEGHVVGRLKYDAYGNLFKSWGTLPDYRYAGLYAQPDTGLYLATFRAYNPSTGRWLSRDPIGILGGNNLYAYVDGNSTNYVDTIGLCPNQCTALQKAAARLASILGGFQRQSEILAALSALGLAATGAGEGVTFGTDTPFTISYAALTEYFTSTGLGAGILAAGLNSFAQGNYSALNDLDNNVLEGFWYKKAFELLPYVGRFSDTAVTLAQQAAEITRKADKVCP